MSENVFILPSHLNDVFLGITGQKQGQNILKEEGLGNSLETVADSLPDGTQRQQTQRSPARKKRDESKLEKMRKPQLEYTKFSKQNFESFVPLFLGITTPTWNQITMTISYLNVDILLASGIVSGTLKFCLMLISRKLIFGSPATHLKQSLLAH